MADIFPIGEYRGVTLEVAAWDGVGADVDLSAICLLSREPAGMSLTGGALHVDQALKGALGRLRTDGVFAAAAGETLMLAPAAGTIAARRLLVIGLGDPENWTAAVTGRAAGLAVEYACQLGDGSVAFAPSLLDAGMNGVGTAAPMIAAVLGVIDRTVRLVDEGLWPTQSLRRVVFDAGQTHAAAAAAGFRTALNAARPEAVA